MQFCKDGLVNSNWRSSNAQKVSALLSYVQVASEALSIHSTLDVFIRSFMWQKQMSRSMAKTPKSATTQKARLQRAQNLWVWHQWWFQWEDAGAKIHTTNIAPEFTEIFLNWEKMDGTCLVDARSLRSSLTSQLWYRFGWWRVATHILLRQQQGYSTKRLSISCQ